MAEVPFPDSYWVVPGLLLAGEHPGSAIPEKAAARIARLLDSGVACCLDLTRPNECPEYADYLHAEAELRGIAAAYHSRPIPDFSIPSRADLSAILDLIDASLAENRGVYLHCRAGIGRTGTVVGCYLVRHGRSGPQALAEIQQLRQETRSWWYSSPESPAQRDLVLSWVAGK